MHARLAETKAVEEGFRITKREIDTIDSGKNQGGRDCGGRGRRRAGPGNYHGLVELLPKSTSTSIRPNQLGAQIMYSIDYIIRGAYIMAGKSPHARGTRGGYTDVLYLNLYTS